MARHRLGSICVGIQEYIDPRFDVSEDKLSHAESDAAWFHEYCKGADTDRPQGRHIFLRGRAATRSELKRAFSTLADGGDYGLVLIFVAGHGSRHTGGGWFSCADAEWNTPDITGPVLQQFLSSIRARTVLVFVDCCFAASILEGCSYFASLPGHSVARIFLGSSRANQRSWESDDIKSGLFTHIIRRSLSSIDRQDPVPFDSELFRALQKQLPLLALRAKQGAAQEPVRVGASTEEVYLPRASVRLSLPAESVRRTVLSLLRSAAYLFLAISLLAFIATEYCTYHFAIENEKIDVRLGIRELAWLIPRSMLVRVNTGIAAADLDQFVFVGPGQNQRSRRENFENESTNGIWLQKDEHGVRRWATHLMSYLSNSASWKIQVDLTGQIPTTLFDGTPSGPSNSLITRAAALGVSAVAQSRWRGLADLGNKFATCQSDPKSSRRQRSDGAPSDDDIVMTLEALRNAAAVGLEESFDLFVGAARALASLESDNDLDGAILRERALSNVMLAMTTARSARGAATVTATERATLVKLADSGCDPWIAIAAALSDPEAEPWTARLDELLSKARPGSLGVREILALDGALWLARTGRPVGQAALIMLSLPTIPDQVLSPFRNLEGRWRVPIVGRQIALRWLDAAAKSISENRFKSAGAQLVLAASQVEIFSDDELVRLSALVKAVASAGASNYVKVASSYLSSARRLDPAKLEAMISAVDWTQPILPFRDNGSLVLGGDQTVSGIELGTVGRAAQRTCVSAAAIASLYDFLARSQGMQELDDLLYGLSAQRPWQVYRDNDARGIVTALVSRLRSRPDEGRSLEIKLLAANSEVWSPSLRQAVLTELRLRWASEGEYEVRSSLADGVQALMIPSLETTRVTRETQCQVNSM